MHVRGQASAADDCVLVLSRSRIVGAALCGALVALGWRAEPGLEQDHLRASHLVLIADEKGLLPPTRQWAGRACAGVVIAIGSRRRLEDLIQAVEAGARVALDADQPWHELIERLHQLLLEPRLAGDPGLLARLRTRAAEARRFQALTPREREVMAALLEGHGAAEIARLHHVSLPTVRSHIRSVLGKLQRTSQMGALALALRSCGEDTLLQKLDQIHHF